MNNLNLDAAISLLVQAPLVGVFVWFAVKMANQSAMQVNKFIDALDKRDQEYLTRNNAVIDALGKLSANIANLTERTCSHDEVMRESLREINQHRRQTDK
jgi:CRISPR/Cas system CSM-associated protein Csm2 small subunit